MAYDFSAVNAGDTITSALMNSVTTALEELAAGPIVTVAAANSPASYKAAASIVCTGTSGTRTDHTTIQNYINNNLSGGGTLDFAPGTYYFGGTLDVGGTLNPNNANEVNPRYEQVHLRFSRGANINFSTVTGETPLIRFSGSNCTVEGGKFTGSGRKGSGIGVQFGNPALDQPGGCHVIGSRFEQLKYGVQFGVQTSGGTGSTGDCSVQRCRIRLCNVGLHSEGFVNWVSNCFISECNINIQQGELRNSGKLVIINCTTNQWGDCAIDLRRGRGHTIINLWAEHTAVQKAADNTTNQHPTEVIRLGSASYTVNNVTLAGLSHIHPIDAAASGGTGVPEQYGVRLVRCRALRVEHLEMTNELPSVAFVRVDNHAENVQNVIEQISIGDNAPTGYTFTHNLSNAATHAYPVVIKAVPESATANAGTVVGLETPHAASTYTVATNGAGVFWVKHRNGHVQWLAQDTATPTSGLKAVLTNTIADGVSYWFTPNTKFQFPLDPAGVEDHFAPNGYVRTKFRSDGTAILSNWRDDSIGGYATTPDVEPISCTRMHDIEIDGLVIWAGGNRDANNSSDAFDFDGCRGVKVRNCIVERSRARGGVADAGDKGAVSYGCEFSNNEFRGVPPAPSVYNGPTVAFVAQEYRYVLTYVDSIYGETAPSEFTPYTPDGTRQPSLVLPIGPAYDATRGVTARKLYRWSEGQPTYRLVATIDNATKTYTDTTADATIAAAAQPPAAGASMIPMEGIKLLGGNRNRVRHNLIIGVGSHGVQAVRKGTTAADTVPSNSHLIQGNHIRRAGVNASTANAAGVYLGAASRCKVVDNDISNSGNVANRGVGIWLQGLAFADTARNVITGNSIYDDQDANAPAGAKTTAYGIHVSNSGVAPDRNTFDPNSIDGMFTADYNIATATNSVRFADLNHSHLGGGASPVTLGWRAGRWYGTRAVMAHSAPATAGTALVANQLMAAPFYVPTDVTVTSIACNVGTAGTAGVVGRMGIYTAGSNGLPSTLVVETANFAMDTTGDKVQTISAALTGGTWYYTVVVSDGTPAIMMITTGHASPQGASAVGSTSRAAGALVTLAGGWSALPATWTGTSTSGNVPLVEVSF